MQLLNEHSDCSFLSLFKFILYSSVLRWERDIEFTKCCKRTMVFQHPTKIMSLLGVKCVLLVQDDYKDY